MHLGIPVSRQVREIFVPVLPSELAGALLTVSIAVLYRETGVAALALLALVLVVFQYLIRELLRSQRRAEELAALQLGVLASMLETLALRDRMTARHSAAVARYARALAEAHGCSREQQDLAHTAGLLHDIGKFSFPDAILLAEQPLSDEDWRIVRRHPEEGARVVARMEAYGPVADIILGHHERWDGQGYPRAPGRRGDPAARPRDHDRRRLRRDDRPRLLPPPAHVLGGRLGAAARPPARSSTPRSWRRSSSCSATAACASVTPTTPTSRPSSRSSAASGATPVPGASLHS